MNLIAVKTGDLDYAGSAVHAELELCDGNGICCKTAENLDNSGDDRERGAVDEYKDSAILGTCFAVIFRCPSFSRNHYHSLASPPTIDFLKSFLSKQNTNIAGRTR